MPTKQPTVDELLKETAITQRGGTKCWGSHLDGDAKSFMDGCQKKVDNNEPFHAATALRIAQEVFGVRVKITAFTKHLTRNCGCYEVEKQ